MWKIILYLLILVDCICSGEKIIVIGAGAAGIAAASKLLGENITDFRILEAQNRIGGRIHSVFVGDAYVDLGAEFVQGQNGNIAYDLAKDYVKPGLTLKDATIYYKGHAKLNNTLMSEFVSIYEKLDVPENINISVGKAFLAEYSNVLSKYRDNPDMYAYAKNFIRTVECLILSIDGSFSWFSTSCYPIFEEAEGDQALSWHGLGYKTILDILLKNFPHKNGYKIDNHISFNKTVSKIDLNEKSVKIKCNDGSEYIAEHVIFTPSVGVLKHDHQKMFAPKLSDKKIKAINDLGFDGVIKIILEFPNNWWGKEQFFFLVWSEEDRKALIRDAPSGPTKDGDHWLSWFADIVTAPSNPRVLIGWYMGPLVPLVEKLSEEELKNGTMYAMRKFLGAEFNITEPIKVLHSRWVTNPNIRGTYSYDTIKSRTEHKPSVRDILIEPVTGQDGIPRILFAGEATSTNRSGMVDGAIGTGLREADRLVKIIKK